MNQMIHTVNMAEILSKLRFRAGQYYQNMETATPIYIKHIYETS